MLTSLKMIGVYIGGQVHSHVELQTSEQGRFPVRVQLRQTVVLRFRDLITRQVVTQVKNQVFNALLESRGESL